jgi:hypothetical protein
VEVLVSVGWFEKKVQIYEEGAALATKLLKIELLQGKRAAYLA